ncbi:exocyst complex component 3-like protein 4 [Sphaerodactylus townsendi]|uniref:exocyst complex component 3-like protein 4 n=1 Tax=Sphaerodactylus townsendi TaxID=933632 RepID=UPI002027544F|nr:exocyst complex component 3-like protein 4 [Sphaerodactylus townsendi]
MLSFRRKISQSFKEPGILRSSKRFATKWIEGRIQAHRESKNLSEESETLEDDKKEPLSVMEINTLIQRRQLLEAFENIKDLEMDLLVERDSKKYEDNPKEYTVKAKDIELLYDHISKVIRQIVQEMLDLSSLDEKALTSLAILIETEEEIHSETSKVTSSDGPAALGSARNWRDLWKEAVNQSVKGRVSNVPVPSKEDTEYWLSVHLESLRTAIRDDLLKVKSHIQEYYPQDYNVCDTYMEAFHKALSVHLQGILEDNTLTLSEFYALLNWIHNVYLSEEFLGHPDLKPDLKIEDLPSLLTPEAMAQLKDDYINSVKEKTKVYLDNILVLTERKWDSKERPEAPQSQYCSSLSLDIQMMVGQHVKTSGNICESLKGATLEISVKEVLAFVPRFEKAFLAWDRENNQPQFVELMVTNINDLHDLMTGLRENFSDTRQELEKTLNDVMLSYQKHFLHKLRPKTQPMFKKILSREWILHSRSEDSFIQKALSVTEEFSKPLIHLKESSHKENFLQEIHKDVVKEYVTQTLKSKRKMKRRKWEEVRKLMKQDATTIDDCMKHLGSTSDWLSSAIPRIADIIGEKKKPKVNEHLKNLSQDYPDIRREHVLALLALRGWWRNTRRSMADQIDGLSEGLETAPNKTLFAEIELPNTIRCFWRS